MNKCFKCKQGIGTVVSRDGPSKLYCTDCFLAYCAGVVRENILQQCRVPSDMPLAVAVSGGPNSMMMLYELGQMRHKAHEQIRRQQQRQQPAQQEHACRESEHWQQTPQRKVPTVGTSSISSLILLPFHLCEDELVLPPPPSSSSPSKTFSRHESSGRHEAIKQVRATMMQQFTTLRKYVQQQPPRWVCHDEVSAGHKKKKEKYSVTAKGEMVPCAPPLSMENDDDSKTSPWPQSMQRHTKVGGETTAAMFGEAEMRVFHYSDFLPNSYVHEVHHSLHASRLSLGDREALYARVRQQTLCRAAQRVCTEYLQREADPAAVPGSAAGEEFSRRDDAHTLPTDTSSKTWSHLLLGSNAVRCATAALEALVTGAGGEGVVHGAGFRGFTHEVVCLRPLRTMLPRETIMYTRLCGISCDYTPALCTATAAPSVHRTLERFVLTMMASYRTMIFNVLNTVQKLEVHPAAMRKLVSGTVDTHALDAHTDRDDPAAGVRSLQSAGKTRRKAFPSRTAQQNRDDLRQIAPPPVHRDSHGMHTEEPSSNEAVAMCCVCGLPAPAPARKHPLNGTAEVRQSLLFAVSTTDATPPSSTTALAAAPSEVSVEAVSCFLCYACRAFSDAWPSSIFGETSAKDSDSFTHGKSGNAMSPTSSTLRLCELFR